MRVRAGVILLTASVVLAACGVDAASNGGVEELTVAPSPIEGRDPPAIPQPDPSPVAPPPARESPTPEPEPAPTPEPSPAPAEPAAPPSPPAGDAVEVAITLSGFGAFGDARRRAYSGSTNLPAGAVLAYEVMPARYESVTGLWRADDGSDEVRRGLVQTRPRESGLQTTWGTMTLDFSFEVDITGFPCAPSEPRDVLDVEACPLVTRIWFATVLDGPWGQVQQPDGVRAVVGERGELMAAPPCVGCSTLAARDRQRVEYFWPRVDPGTQRIASTRFLSAPLNPERFRP